MPCWLTSWCLLATALPQEPAGLQDLPLPRDGRALQFRSRDQDRVPARLRAEDGAIRVEAWR